MVADGPSRLRERLPAQPHSVPRVRHAVEEFAAGCGASERQRSAIALAVSEAVSNAVVHAYVGRDGGDVAIEAEVRGRMLEVTVRDEGIGLAPRLDSPGLGLGMGLIASLSDRLELTEIKPGVRVSMAFAIG